MKRARKIIIIGFEGFERQAEDLRIECFSWQRLQEVKNFADYDDIVMYMPNRLEPLSLQGETYDRLLSKEAMSDVLWSKSRITIVGDPRFSIELHPNQGRSQSRFEFLEWTGIAFDWDDRSGDTVVPRDELDQTAFWRYISSLRCWKYCLRHCEMATVSSASKRKGYSHKLEIVDLARNRYHRIIAFYLDILVQRKVDRGTIEHKKFVDETVSRSGRVYFLPLIELPPDETLLIVLQDILGVSFELPEPEWIDGVSAYGQEEIDSDITTIEKEMSKLTESKVQADGRRVEARKALKLLYDRGESLEQVVRDILRQLGAEVEEPEVKGQEDGWISYSENGEEFQGVLEIKTTRKKQFRKDGLRQLLDWKSRGIEIRRREYKGVFIGSNSVTEPLSERPGAFSDDLKETATLSKFVAMKTEDLYAAYILDQGGKLNRADFWRRVFSTDGIFDALDYHESLKKMGEMNPWQNTKS